MEGVGKGSMNDKSTIDKVGILGINKAPGSKDVALELSSTDPSLSFPQRPIPSPIQGPHTERVWLPASINVFQSPQYSDSGCTIELAAAM